MAGRRATVALELAVVSGILLTVSFGIIGAGIILWTMNGLQSIAMNVARCGAVGDSNCPSTSQAKAYAVTLANSQLMANVITAASVTAANNPGSCQGFTGKFYTVSITSSYFSTGPMAIIAQPMNIGTFTVSACFPMA
jgi:Flp pilus assembly protein TadG